MKSDLKHLEDQTQAPEKWEPTADGVVVPGVPRDLRREPKLNKRRSRTGIRTRPDLTVEQILEWADIHHERTGEWPTASSGIVQGGPGIRWGSINVTLQKGYRGLQRGLSLAKLLAEHRGVRNRKGLRPLSAAIILAWADAHQQRTGAFPTNDSGPIPEAPGESWQAVNIALSKGLRGLPGGGSLPRLLSRYRGVPNKGEQPRLTTAKIISWAEKHHEETGQWPSSRSGPVMRRPGETWLKVDKALRAGQRGLPGASSLSKLLADELGVRKRSYLPHITEEMILAWADEYRARTGKWPKSTSGPIQGTRDESWASINNSLHQGDRGLRGSQSLPLLLNRRRGAVLRYALPPLTTERILAWADQYYARTGKRPTHHSGPILESPGDTWSSINQAIANHRRGLEGPPSLYQLLLQHRPSWFEDGSRPPGCAPEQRPDCAHSRCAPAGEPSDRNSRPVAGAPVEA